MIAQYRGVRAKLDEAITDFEQRRRDATDEWLDDAAAATAHHLDAGVSAATACLAAIDRQVQAHGSAERLADLIARQASEAAERGSAARHEANEAAAVTHESVAASTDARGQGRLSGQILREALASVGSAGAACGEMSRSGALEGLVHNRVVDGRQRQVWTMIAKSVGIEVVHFAAGEVAEKLLGIPDGSLPESFKADVEEALSHAGTAAAARVTAAVKRLADADWRNEL